MVGERREEMSVKYKVWTTSLTAWDFYPNDDDDTTLGKEGRDPSFSPISFGISPWVFMWKAERCKMSIHHLSAEPFWLYINTSSKIKQKPNWVRDYKVHRSTSTGSSWQIERRGGQVNKVRNQMSIIKYNNDERMWNPLHNTPTRQSPPIRPKFGQSHMLGSDFYFMTFYLDDQVFVSDLSCKTISSALVLCTL